MCWNFGSLEGLWTLSLFIRWSAPSDIFGHHCFHHCWPLILSFSPCHFGISAIIVLSICFSFFLCSTCLLFSLFFLLVSQPPCASKVKLFFKGTTYCKGWDLKSRRAWWAFYPLYFQIKYATELLSNPANSIIFPQNNTSRHLYWKQGWALNRKKWRIKVEFSTDYLPWNVRKEVKKRLFLKLLTFPSWYLDGSKIFCSPRTWIRWYVSVNMHV